MTEPRDKLVERILEAKYGPAWKWPPIRSFLTLVGVGIVGSIAVLAITSDSLSLALFGTASGVLGGLITGASFILWEMRKRVWVGQMVKEFAASELSGEEE